MYEDYYARLHGPHDVLASTGSVVRAIEALPKTNDIIETRSKEVDPRSERSEQQDNGLLVLTAHVVHCEVSIITAVTRFL